MTATTAATKLVTFKLGEDLFAADIYSVERVLRYQTPTPIPNVPEWIEGVIDYQERVVPVINLRRRFELPPLQAGNEMRTLVFNADGDWIAGVGTRQPALDGASGTIRFDGRSGDPVDKTVLVREAAP